MTFCVECGKVIPESRIKLYPHKQIVTCSKICSNGRTWCQANKRKKAKHLNTKYTK